MYGERLGLGYWIVGFVVVGGAVGYWHFKHPFDKPTYISAPSPSAAIEAADAFKSAPAAPKEIKPVTVGPVTASTPTPAPVTPAVNELPAQAQANPEVYDVPVTISYADLAQEAKFCPKRIRLKVDANFPAIVDGKQVGSALAPAGTEVDFIKVAGEKSIVIGFGPSELTINADATNFEDLYIANVKAARKR